MDRDDVIKRLERACQLVWNGERCNIRGANDALDVAYAIHDAIALLQKQKAVRPEWRNDGAYCDHCGNKLTPTHYGLKFCDNCGCEIDWGVGEAYRGKRSKILNIVTPDGVFTITPEGEDEK
jgi:hypothetical protein